MRDIPAAIAAARSQRGGIISHHLIWIVAKDRTTGKESAIGFWTGDDHQDFTIGGKVRTYYGAGTTTGLPEIVQEVGVQVRDFDITLSGIAPEVEMATRGYDARLAPCEVHRVELSVDSGLPLAAPQAVVDGEVSKLVITIPAEGGEATANITVQSNAVMLTRPLTLKRSDESLRARRPKDPFLQYAKISGTNGDPWGAKR